MKDNSQPMAHGAPDDVADTTLMQRLIDDPAGTLGDPALRVQIEADPTLRELADDLTAMTPALESLGRASVPPVAASLRARVRQMADASLSREPVWRRAFEALWSPRGRLGLAAAAACALFATLVMYQQSVAPVGRLDYTASAVTVGGHLRTNQSRATLQRGDRLATDGQSAGLVSLGETTRLALDRNSEVEVLAADHILLTRGRIFLRVRGQEGIMVTLPDGTAVRDIGTVFGVALTSGAPEVDVTDGLVEVATDGQTVQIRAGEFLALTAEALAPAARPDGTALPSWVTEVLDEEHRTHVEQFVPSARGL